MGNKRKILFFISFFVVILFLAYGLLGLANIIGKSIFDTRAVQQSASVSVLVEEEGQFEDIDPPDSGNLSFPQSIIKKHLSLITGLNSSWSINVSLRNSSLPYGWNISQPNSSIMNVSLVYFEINVGNVSNNGTLGGDYRIYFNVSKTVLGSNSTSNVRLYVFDNSGGWTELSTTLVSDNVNSVEFYATLTHFSRFLIGIKPTSSDSGDTGGTGSSGAGGGGGSKEEKAVYLIILDKETIKTEIEIGDEKEEFLQIKNNGNKKLNLNLNVEPQSNFLFIEDGVYSGNLYLEVSEAKYVKLKISAKDLEEGVYVGKLIIESPKVTKVVPVVLDVKGKGKALFDVEVAIPSKYQIVKAGERVVATVTLFNLGVTDKIDASIEYKILDLNGEIIITETEEEEVETQSQKTKGLNIPSYLKPGKYVYVVEVKYFDGEKQSVASASAVFEVGEKSELESPLNFGFGNLSSSIIFVALFLAVIMIMLLIQLRVLDTIKDMRDEKKIDTDITGVKRIESKDKPKENGAFFDVLEELKRMLK